MNPPPLPPAIASTLTPLEILVNIARLAGERGAGKYGIKILSFTAEEFGDPEDNELMGKGHGAKPNETRAP